MQILSKNITKKEIVIAVITMIILALLFILQFNIFIKELQKEPVVNIDADESNPDHIKIFMQVTGIDPVKGDLQIRMLPDPEGNLTEDGYTLAKDVTIYTNSNSGRNEFNFAKGKRMNPFEVTVEMYDGFVMEYPYDKHTADAELYVTSQEKDSAGQIKTVSIPIVKKTNFTTSIQGYKFTSVNEVVTEQGYTYLQLKLERATSVKMFSWFIMLLFWFIAFAVILVVASIVIRKRKIEYSMFAFLSAMLFALPALRNVQPFVPTIGCLADYIAFFWAEGIVAAGLVVMVFTWLKRPGAKQT
ncbi:MAG: DUF4436 domain-containing protein [Ignavibacteriae bacterium]|nr:MAG: DUF4436 domain-containing protein [Ignavibacteriota bacterium]